MSIDSDCDARSAQEAANDPAFLFRFDNSYAKQLPGMYVRVQPAHVPAPRLAWLNEDLASELGVDAAALREAAGVQMLAGNALPLGAEPLAQAYAGHQFGNFSPQLGDGRALLLGEVIDRHGRRRDIALKGSGRTPFSRGGDGKAALGPVLREALLGEAMRALRIPTTRALAAVLSGEMVHRQTPMPGAVLVRVAESHLRVGTLEYFAAREDVPMLRRVADYAIARHDPDLSGQPDRYMRFLSMVVARQAALIARWMGVGFIHGVMNTDNMTLSGETIDYGPCAFMEAYDPATAFSSIDSRGRYAYVNQPPIAAWNLARLAESLLPLMQAEDEFALEQATEVVQGFSELYQVEWLSVFRAKLGLDDAGSAKEDKALADDFLGLLNTLKVDFTLGFRHLLGAAEGDATALLDYCGPDAAAMEPWLTRWYLRVGVVSAETLQTMRHANPAYIARNHQVEAALEAAVNNDDFAPFNRLLDVVKHPFDEREQDAEFSRPAPPEQTACYQTFCGT